MTYNPTVFTVVWRFKGQSREIETRIEAYDKLGAIVEFSKWFERLHKGESQIIRVTPS